MIMKQCLAGLSQSCQKKNTLRRYLCTDTQDDLKLPDKAICFSYAICS